MTSAAKKPIRITPAFFFLLLTLVEGQRHGYAMAREVEERSGGSVKLGPGSLYWSLGRLESVGLIAEVVEPEPDAADERRRYYRLTDVGSRVLAQELQTMSKVVDFARDKQIV